MDIFTLIFVAALMIGIGVGIRKGYRLSKAAFLLLFLLFAYTLVNYVKGFPYSGFTARAPLGILATLIDTGVAASNHHPRPVAPPSDGVSGVIRA